MTDRAGVVRDGLLAGPDRAARQGAPEIATGARDTPFRPRDPAMRPAKAPSGPALAASPGSAGPVRCPATLSLWSVALRRGLPATLSLSLARIVPWTGTHAAGTAAFDTATHNPFVNTNTPQDMAAAAAMGTA